MKTQEQRNQEALELQKMMIKSFIESKKEEKENVTISRGLSRS